MTSFQRQVHMVPKGTRLGDTRVVRVLWAAATLRRFDSAGHPIAPGGVCVTNRHLVHRTHEHAVVRRPGVSAAAINGKRARTQTCRSPGPGRDRAAAPD